MSSTRRTPALEFRAAARLGVVVIAGLLLVGAATPAAGAPTQPTCATASTANGRYVTFLYDEILGRCPDVAGRAHWTALLDHGASRWSVAESLDNSTENLGRNNVDDLYQGILGRTPTTNERAYWISYIRSAHEDAVPTVALLASTEGYAKHTTAGAGRTQRDQEWLAYAYNRILDRAPDAHGAAFYLGQLGPDGSTRTTRTAVAMTLERSASNANSWVRATMAEALGRTPDDAGIHYWTAWLTGPGHWQTFRLWTHQLSSDEAFQRAQL